MDKYVVNLRTQGSDEGFEYDNLAEAIAGIRRLARSAERLHKQDGVDREITLFIGGDEG